MASSIEQAEAKRKANEALYQKLRASGKGPVGSSDGGLGDQRETIQIGAVTGRNRDVEIDGKEVTVQGKAKVILQDGEVEFLPGGTEADFASTGVDQLRHIAPGLMPEAKAALAADRERKKRELREKAGNGSGKNGQKPTFGQLKEQFDIRSGGNGSGSTK